jgi:hypothetical protein
MHASTSNSFTHELSCDTTLVSDVRDDWELPLFSSASISELRFSARIGRDRLKSSHASITQQNESAAAAFLRLVEAPEFCFRAWGRAYSAAHARRLDALRAKRRLVNGLRHA